MRIKGMLSVVQCCIIILSLSACGKSESDNSNYSQSAFNGQTAPAFNNQTTHNVGGVERLKSFSSEKELEDYSCNFWVCEEENDTSNYKILFFYDKTCYSWNFSYSSNEKLSDCIEKVLNLDEERDIHTFRNSNDLLLSELNVEGLKSEKFAVLYDAENSQINNSNGQTLGKFLYNDTLKCGDELYKKDELKKLNQAFIAAKVGHYIETHGELATYKDVKYDPINYFGKKFLLVGTAELDDYFNYDYRDLEGYYFCIRVIPTGGSISDRWYIYAERDEYRELFDKLKNGSSEIVLVCLGARFDSIQHEMATLIDYWY